MYKMQGYPLDSCTYSFYDNSTSITDHTCQSIMEDMGNIKDVSWLSLINMKEELINHMKESVVIEEPVNESINELSSSLIQFMKDFHIQLDKMTDAEKKMKQVIEDTQKEIEIITTFIEFLSKLSSKTEKDIEPLQTQINSICDDIKKNSKMEEVKKTYLVEKHKFHQHVNLLRLINQMNVGSTCSICLQENVDSYFNPCGHTGCQKCMSKNAELERPCPLCRKQVISIHKLFFI